MFSIKLLIILAFFSNIISIFSSEVNEKGAEEKRGRGPVSDEAFDMFPRLNYLGEFNGKHFYQELNRVDQLTARSNCGSMGMKLARLASQAELNFLTEAGVDDYSWTDGASIQNPSAYVWSTGSGIPSNIAMDHENRLGLLTDKHSPDTKLYPQVTTSQNPYICYV